MQPYVYTAAHPVNAKDPTGRNPYASQGINLDITLFGIAETYASFSWSTYFAVDGVGVWAYDPSCTEGSHLPNVNWHKIFCGYYPGALASYKVVFRFKWRVSGYGFHANYWYWINLEDSGGWSARCQRVLTHPGSDSAIVCLQL